QSIDWLEHSLRSTGRQHRRASAPVSSSGRSSAVASSLSQSGQRIRTVYPCRTSYPGHFPSDPRSRARPIPATIIGPLARPTDPRTEALRDWLALVRAMYRAARDRGAGKLELERIAAVGRDLAEALDLVCTSRPDTVGARAGWARAERAAQAVGDLVQLTD